MSAHSYYAAVRQRWLLILITVLVSTGCAAAAVMTAQPVYRAEAQLFVSTSSADGQPSGLNQGGQFAQQRVKSYADIMNSPGVTSFVIGELGLATTPRALAGKITATAPLDTVLINVDVEDSSPVTAQRIADAVAARFTVVATTLETTAGLGSSPVKVSVVRQADLPSGPVSPHKKLGLALGVLVGLVAGVGVAVLRETLDTTVKDSRVLHEALHLPTLGVISFDRNSVKRPLIVQADPRSGRAEAFRQLRTNLQFLDVDSPPRSLLLTSSLPGEGKSTTACNLAITLTQAGLRVILVEGDLRRPRVAQYLGVEGAVGLTDVLVGRADLEDVLQPWGDGLLQVLTSGPLPPNPSELLGSGQMQAVLRQLEDKADVVLVDAPPLLPVTDAAVLSAITSGAILVVRAGVTRREHAARAIEVLRGIDAVVYGAVLNMAPTKGLDAYTYGYGYEYDHAGGDAPGRHTVRIATAAIPAGRRPVETVPDGVGKVPVGGPSPVAASWPTGHTDSGVSRDSLLVGSHAVSGCPTMIGIVK